MQEVKIIEDTKTNIEMNIILNNGYEYLVECYLVGDDTDTYAIRAYDTIHSDINPYNCNEVLYGLFDSDGGTFEGFECYLDLERNNNQEIINELEDLIMDVLFNERNGLITKYQGTFTV